MFCKKVVLRNFTKFTRKHLCQCPFFTDFWTNGFRFRFFRTSVLRQVRFFLFFFWDKYFREKWFSLGFQDKCFLGAVVSWRHFSLVLVQVQALATELQNTLRKKINMLILTADMTVKLFH